MWKLPQVRNTVAAFVAFFITIQRLDFCVEFFCLSLVWQLGAADDAFQGSP